MCNKRSRNIWKRTCEHVRLAKIQISLRIIPVRILDS